METEIWKKIPGYGLYEASTFGRIKTFNWKGCGREAIMKPAKDNGGYFRTMLKRDDGIIHTVKVHRIIASTFLSNELEKPCVNHINGIRDDNRIENLEWVTISENIKHSFKIGLSSNKGSGCPTAKLTESQVLEIRAKFIPRKCGRKELAKMYGVFPATIKGIILRKSWTHI